MARGEGQGGCWQTWGPLSQPGQLSWEKGDLGELGEGEPRNAGQGRDVACFGRCSFTVPSPCKCRADEPSAAS